MPSSSNKRPLFLFLLIWFNWASKCAWKLCCVFLTWWLLNSSHSIRTKARMHFLWFVILYFFFITFIYNFHVVAVSISSLLILAPRTFIWVKRWIWTWLHIWFRIKEKFILLSVSCGLVTSIWLLDAYKFWHQLFKFWINFQILIKSYWN